MNATTRDVVSSFGSAVIAGIAMMIFCAAADKTTAEYVVQGFVLVAGIVSASNLARWALLQAIEHKFGPDVHPEHAFYKTNYFIQREEAKYWMLVARDAVLADKTPPRTAKVRLVKVNENNEEGGDQ